VFILEKDKKSQDYKETRSIYQHMISFISYRDDRENTDGNGYTYTGVWAGHLVSQANLHVVRADSHLMMPTYHLGYLSS